VVTFPDGAHGSLDRPCPARIMRDFLNNTTQPPDQRCVTQIPLVRFRTP
jgi:hypothetical protein